MTLRVLDAEVNSLEWDDCYGLLPYDLQDVHFTAGWARAHGGGKLAVLVSSQQEFVMLQPFALREIAGSGGLCDMTTWGYGGPISNAAIPSHDDADLFEAYLSEWRVENRVVSEFALLNPVLASHQALLLPVMPKRVGEATVLFADDAALKAGMKANRRQSIQRALGARVEPTMRLHDFHTLHAAAMLRKGASRRDMLSYDDLMALAIALPNRVQIVGAYMDDALQAAALFLHGNATSYYLLAATSETPRSGCADICVLAGFEEAIRRGIPWVYLGGGREAGDTLSTYKRSFGGTQRGVYALKRIYRPDDYARLSAGRDVAFFPAYRSEEAEA